MALRDEVDHFSAGLTTTQAPFIEEAQSHGQLYIEQPYDLYSEENHRAWRKLFARMQDRWAAEAPAFGSIIEERKFAEVGSFATMLGFEIRGLDGPEPSWRAVALGDTVLFHVRAARLIAVSCAGVVISFELKIGT